MKSISEPIITFSGEPEAHLARTVLMQRGIDASVHRYSRYRAMAGGGYELKTPLCDAEEARRMLDRIDGDVDTDEHVDSDDTSHRRCPKCESVNVVHLPLPGWLVIFGLFTAGLSFLFVKTDWRCKKCGHRWRG